MMRIELVEMDRATKIGFAIAIISLAIFVIVSITQNGGM